MATHNCDQINLLEAGSQQTCVPKRSSRRSSTGFAMTWKVKKWVLWLSNSPRRAYTMLWGAAEVGLNKMVSQWCKRPDAMP